MLYGELISFGAIEIVDLIALKGWRNSPYLSQFFREHRELSYSDQKKWFEKLQDKSEYFFGIRLTSTNELIGVAGLNYINWINRICQLSIYIGKENLYLDENGWADETLTLIELYAFEALNLHKIFCEVFEFDLLKINLLKKNQFKIEAELFDHVFKNGKYFSSFVFSKIRE